MCDHDLETASYEENAAGYGLTRAAMGWFWDHYLGPDGDARPPRGLAAARGRPRRCARPRFVLTVEHDPLRDEGEAYARRLEAGGRARRRCSRYPGVVHGFIRMPGTMARGNEALDECAGALRAAFSD